MNDQQLEPIREQPTQQPIALTQEEYENQMAQVAKEAIVPPQPEYGPRRISFFILVLKTLAGFVGGLAGTAVLVIIFLASSSILQPVLGIATEAETATGQVSPLFMVILMAMIFATSLVSSLLGTLLIAYTERDRYTKIATTMGQVFIVNIVIFAFVLPIYLSTSSSSIELSTYAAALQVILSATASTLILELIHDAKYNLLAVYTTILAILAATGVNFFLYFGTGNATILLFTALPIIWGMIGFSQAAISMFYFWIFQTWGTDYLANTASFGTDYGVPDQTEEEEAEEELREDIEGGDFLKQ